ncbi:WAT1-related protein At5g64700-like [Phalaenopsis equestris]|uniref:WAT1-related protein At5g64700-like n=1 Tax=Phalaenopsis equestris TaxID=78828 RepID=UPI0009E291FD|nr:WAT1-related protein At5g64700-like [Phalaenopsis equestris]
MEGKKPYAVIILIQLIYTGLFVISKVALDEGLSTFTFLFYRQLTSTVLLVPLAIFSERNKTYSLSFWLSVKIFMHALIGITFSLNIYNIGLKYTSATVGSAATNCIPVITFFLALLMRMETLKLRRMLGISKILGIGICKAGVITIALYSGPHLNPLIKYHHFGHKNNAKHSSLHSKQNWITGTFLLIAANSSWSLWMVLQGRLLKEFPSKVLFTAIESVFSALQSFIIAAAFERDVSKWKLRMDMGLVAIAYSGFIVTGVSFYLQSWCIEKKGPVFLAMSTPLSLVFTILCSLFLLGDAISLGSVLGGILMVGGLYGVLWGKRRENYEPKPAEENAGVCNENKDFAPTDDHV